MNASSLYEQKPWLALYPPKQPAEITPQFSHMLAAFEASLQRDPEATALLYFDGKLSQQDLDQAAQRLAVALHSRGFGAGDRLGLFTQNNPAFVIGLLAAWKLGAIGVCINPMNKARELRHVLQDSGATALLCLDQLYLDVARDVIANDTPQVATVITCAARDGQSLDDARVFALGQRLSAPDGVLDLQHIIDTPVDTTLPRPTLGADDVALLTYTSGTTGNPKGAMNTHGNLAFNAQTYRDWLGLTPQDRILGLAPLFHITGSVAHLSLAMLVGCPLILAHRFQPESMLDTLRMHRPTFTIGAITAFISLMNTPQARKDDFASFRAIYSGGAPISPATNAEFEKFSGQYIHNAFGMTETASPTHLVPLGKRAPVDPHSGALSIGVPVFNTTVWILNDEGQAATLGEVGEIVDRGPQVMRGYWNMPDATTAAIPDGRLRTGDVGFMDGDGWFYLVDRKKDMINAGGYKVWPREVEDVLYSHPAVREAAVIGVPDDYRGETVKAVVSLKPGADVSPEDLMAHCKAQMAAYKYPRIVSIVDELPKTVTGKILRRSLR
ncbi:long-chain-fatty-acid--CoA ligase [Lampropedia aestuarii]|uniref:long-chain-fatty-acid--CoA ligase n=1 Tax=Lampropedia aestuarii TaxID=2562762 RepID=UPI0024696A00|nr:long-chain fatty acid--CoA ligase [Lampropedia aestuarii]MDH5857368.1 long-chain fatty acid--CoA ligase [Lampropedia aestuarii]